MRGRGAMGQGAGQEGSSTGDAHACDLWGERRSSWRRASLPTAAGSRDKARHAPGSHRHQRAHVVGTGGRGGCASGGRGRRREVSRTGGGRGGRGDVPRPRIHRLAGEATGRGGVEVGEISSRQAAQRSAPLPPKAASPLEAQPRRIVEREDSGKSDRRRRAGGHGKEGPPWPPPPSSVTLGSGRRNRSRRQARKWGTRTRTRNQRPGIAKTCRPRAANMDGGGGGEEDGQLARVARTVPGRRGSPPPSSPSRGTRAR